MFRRRVPVSAVAAATSLFGEGQLNQRRWYYGRGFGDNNQKVRGPVGGDSRLTPDAIVKGTKSTQVERTPMLGAEMHQEPLEYVNPANPRIPATGAAEDAANTPIEGGSGPDNRPGIYSRPAPMPAFASGDRAAAPVRENNFAGKPGREDNISNPEYKTSAGEFEVRPPNTGYPGALRYEGYARGEPTKATDMTDYKGHSPVIDHHPFYDYRNRTGARQGFDTANNAEHWDLKAAAHSLYRSCLQGLPLVKQYYWFNLPLDQMKDRIRKKFRQNRYVKDVDAIRNLLMLGWTDYTEVITFRKQKAGVAKFFSDSDSMFVLAEMYTEQEGKLLEERRTNAGGEQKKEGPYDGFWSLSGKQNYEEFQKLAGRIPMAWNASKGYFETWKCDGTQHWEKNLDYEGWFIKNVDPDRASARKEIQNWVAAGYQQPKHYASKNRRAYRRMCKDLDAMLKNTTHELYAASREQLFQYFIRDGCPETNRLYAEKKLAQADDDIFTTRFDIIDTVTKQVMREFPNPRLWKTDAFYFRYKYLLDPKWELNWVKAPIGKEQEKLFNEWVSNDAHYTALHSEAFAAIKKDKARNPMAKTWSDFYREYDPDRPETRSLPWYHKDFDYEKRHHWDERCMRMKKWVASGDIDFKNAFFESQVAEWEQFVNRAEIVRKYGPGKRYAAPRMVQLYRSLIKRIDIAIANQMCDALSAAAKKDVRKLPAAQVQALVDAHNWSGFVFKVPAVVLPDGVEQPKVQLDGTPVEEKIEA